MTNLSNGETARNPSAQTLFAGWLASAATLNSLALAMLVVCALSASAARAADPDESGIGGTGRGTEAMDDADIFDRPELPDRIERVEMPGRPEFSGAPDLPTPPGDVVVPPSVPGDAAPATQ